MAKKTQAQIAAIDNKIIAACTSQGLSLPHAQMIVGQAHLESADYSSPLFVDAFNLFGMTMPLKRPHPHIAGPSNHKQPKYEVGKPNNIQFVYAAYNTIEDSVLDLLDWHKYNKTDWTKISTASDYANYMKQKGYFTGNLQAYIKKITEFVKNVANEVSTEVKKNPEILIFVAIVVGMALITRFFRKKNLR